MNKYTANKYTAEVRALCPFHSSSNQAKEWSEKKTILLFVTKSRELYVRDKNNHSYRSNTKWRKLTNRRPITIEDRLSQLGAVPFDFRGQPRLSN